MSKLSHFRITSTNSIAIVYNEKIVLGVCSKHYNGFHSNNFKLDINDNNWKYFREIIKTDAPSFMNELKEIMKEIETYYVVINGELRWIKN